MPPLGGQGRKPVGKESHRHGELGSPTHFPKWEVNIGSCLALYRHCSKENVNEFGTLNETGDYIIETHCLLPQPL